MEKHKCKLCFKRFANGRALGGHMRSHMMNLPIHKTQHHQLDSVSAAISLSFSSTTSSSENDQNLINGGGCEDEKGMLLSYMLRENPKKSLRLADQDFSFTGSIILDQDRESETESSRNPTRRRSKRTARPPAAFIPQFQADEDANVVKKANKVTTESWTEPEPVSSVHSDTTTEEDVAFCLMMLSRDKWMDDEEEDEYQEDEEEEEEEEDEEDMEEIFEVKKSGSNNRVKGKYVCETCNKSFRTYQALGGHRASHKKIKLSAPPVSSSANVNNNSASKELEEKKVHECPVCFRIFSSGQALGGHKRSHMMGSAAVATIATAAVETEDIAVAVEKKRKFGEISIDLNLPAPIDDDEVSSQVANF